jgi:hypothetical protein
VLHVHVYMESSIICVLGRSELYKQFQRTLIVTSPS